MYTKTEKSQKISTVSTAKTKPAFLMLKSRQISVFSAICKLGAVTLNEKCYIIKKKWKSKSKNTYCMNVPHHMPDDIKHFQQAEPENYG